MGRKGKPDILTVDLVAACVFAGIVVGAWKLGKRSGFAEGVSMGKLVAYEKVLTSL